MDCCLQVTVRDSGKGNILPLDGTSGSIFDHPLCEERYLAQNKDIHKLTGCGEWFGWSIRVLERAR